MRVWITKALWLVVGGLLVQEEAWANKADFHLFHPTPKDQMRELSTDRPDKTESPYTVDAGHFQIETDLITRMIDKPGEEQNTSTYWMYSNLKWGITNWSDFQVIFAPLQTEVLENQGGRTEEEGVSDTLVRYKINLLGNDGGDIAIGVMPFLKIPTAKKELGGNRKVEGGLIIPLTLSLPQEFGLGLMAQFNRFKNDESDAYHTVFINTLSVGRDLWGDLAGYLEFYSESSDQEGAPWVATVDIGFTFGATPDVQLDLGVNVGATPEADDLNPFLGISARI